MAVRRELNRLGADAFYRPAQRPDPRPAPPVSDGELEQLKLNFYPLRDIFPEAYTEPSCEK